MKKCVILLLIPMLILSGCATVSPVSTNGTRDVQNINEKELEQSAQKREYVEDKVDKKYIWLAGSIIGLSCFTAGLLTFILGGLSYTQEQYDEVTSKVIPLMIGGAALGVVSLVLYFTL